MKPEGDYTVDAMLSNMAVSFLESDFEGTLIGGRMAPLVNVGLKSAFYPVHGLEELKVAANEDLISTEGESKLYNPKESKDAYKCETHSEKIEIAEYDRLAAHAAFNIDAAKRIPDLVRRMRRRHEIIVATLFGTTGNYNAANYDTPDTLWDAEGADPVQDIEAAQDALNLACGQNADTIVFPLAVWRKFKNLAAVRNAIKGDNGGAINEADVAKFFNIPNVLVPKAIYDTTKKGQTKVLARTWGTKDVILAYCGPKGLDKDSASSAKTFCWLPEGIGAGALGMLVGLRTDNSRGGVLGVKEGKVDWSYAVAPTGVDEAGKLVSAFKLTGVIS